MKERMPTSGMFQIILTCLVLVFLSSCRAAASDSGQLGATTYPTGTATIEVDTEPTHIETLLPVNPSQTPSITSGQFPLPYDPHVLYIEVGFDNYYIQNIVTGETWPILTTETMPLTTTGEREFLRFIQWSQNGCELILWGEKILRLDLQGVIKQEIADLGDVNAIIKDVTMTADEDRVAYFGIGVSYTPEHDTYIGGFIEIINIDQPSPSYRLSERAGGDAMLVWSPDGQWLGFAEYDLNGVIQVVVVRQDGGERIQLTQFTDQDYDLSSLQWSPDSTAIAFKITDNSESNMRVATISIAGRSTSMNYITSTGVNDIGDIWWQDNATIAVYYYDSVYWYDTNSLTILSSIRSIDIPENYIWAPAPFSDSRVIGFASTSLDHFYLYDDLNRLLMYMSNAKKPATGNFQDWIPLPSSFPGIGSCLP